MYPRRQIKKGQDGFTLVEVLTVMVIIAILSAVSIPSMKGFIDDAKRKTYLTEARSVYAACQTAASELYAGSDLVDKEDVTVLARELLSGELSSELFELELNQAKVESITYYPKNSASITIRINGDIIYGEEQE